MEAIELAVAPEDAGQRIDRFLAQRCGLSRAAVQRFLEAGNVLINGKVPAKSRLLAAEDWLSLCLPPPKDSLLLPEDIPLCVVYEDGDLLVVDKPKGMVVHPAPGHEGGTLVNALLHHCAGGLSGIGGELRPGIVHRIDKDTSGLLVAAKNDAAHTGLSQQFAAHSISREYQAVVHGHMPKSAGEVDAPIGRSEKDRKKMAVTQKGARQATTLYEVLAEYPGFSHLRLRLKTGRTHQIRVHMASLGHPVAGDALYGPKKPAGGGRLQGQCLHAGLLGFIHPGTGAYLQFESPLPEYFAKFIQNLTKKEE